MRHSLIFLALLAACGPKTAPNTNPTATPTPTAPASEPAPAPVLPPAPSSDTTGTAAAPPVAAPAESADKAMVRNVNEAVALLTAADPSRAQRAVEILQGQLKDHPEVAAIHYNLGLAYQALGQELEARRAWTRATEVDPTFAKAWVNLGVLNLRSGRPDLALASFQAGARYAPESIELRSSTVGVLRLLKRYPEAIAEAKAALAINSNAIPVYNELAEVYLDTNQLDLARFALLKAIADIEGAKNNARIHAELGQVYYRLGYTGDAVAEFQQALQLDAYQLSAMLYLASYYLDNRAWTDATPLLERAAALAPTDPGIQLNLGVSYRGEGRFEEAKKAYVESLRLKPSPEPYRNLAVLYGDYMKAYDAALQSIEDFRRAGGGPPEEIDAWIASIKKEQKRIEDKRKKEEARRKKEEDQRAKEADEAAAAAAAQTPPPVDPSAQQPPAPAPEQAPPSPAPAPTPAPTPAPSPSEPAPGNPDPPDPWGG